MDPNRLWEFRSPNLWYDPHRVVENLAGGHITVFVDPQNYKRYAMDMKQFPALA